MRKLALLKTAIISLFALFISLLALGLSFKNGALSISGLALFTAASGLLIYYIVLTQTGPQTTD